MGKIIKFPKEKINVIKSDKEIDTVCKFLKTMNSNGVKFSIIVNNKSASEVFDLDNEKENDYMLMTNDYENINKSEIKLKELTYYEINSEDLIL